MTPTMRLAPTGAKGEIYAKPYYHRTDPFLDYTAPADGDYILGVHDMTYRGGLPYRLVISNHAHLEQVFPMAVVPGEKAALTLFGRNLPGGKATPWKTHDDALEQLPFSFAAPSDPLQLQRFTFARHM